MAPRQFAQGITAVENEVFPDALEFVLDSGRGFGSALANAKSAAVRSLAQGVYSAGDKASAIAGNVGAIAGKPLRGGAIAAGSILADLSTGADRAARGVFGGISSALTGVDRAVRAAVDETAQTMFIAADSVLRAVRLGTELAAAKSFQTAEAARDIVENSAQQTAGLGEAAARSLAQGVYSAGSGVSAAGGIAAGYLQNGLYSTKNLAQAGHRHAEALAQAGQASLFSFFDRVKNNIRSAVRNWLGIVDTELVQNIQSDQTYNDRGTASDSAGILSQPEQSLSAQIIQNNDSVKESGNPQSSGYVQKEIQIIHTNTVVNNTNTNTVIADQETKNRLNQLLRQMDSDRPNYSLGQSFNPPDNLGANTLDIGGGSSTISRHGAITGSSLDIGRGNFTVSASGDAVVRGNFTVSGTQTYSGAAAFSATTTAAVLSVIQGGSGVALQADNIAIKSSTISTNDADTNLLINPNGTGAVQFHTAANYIDSTGNLVLDGDITLTGGGTFYTTDNGNLVFAPNGTGNLVVGDTDNTASIVPFADSAAGYDLGAAAARWYDIYAAGKLDVASTTLESGQLSFVDAGRITTGASKDLILQAGAGGKTQIIDGTTTVDIADGTQALYAVKGATATKLADGTYAVDATGDIRLSGDITVSGGQLNFGAGAESIDNKTANLLKLTTGGDARVVLGDDAGTYQFQIADLGGNVVASIDSDGKAALAGISTSGDISPATDLGASLGDATHRYNDIYVANINTSGMSTSGQAVFTYQPLSTDFAQSSVLVNPSDAIAGAPLLGVGVAGVQKFFVDRDGAGYFAGNVGIGTATPNAIIDIKGEAFSPLTGTVAVTSGGAYVVGSGTLFTSELDEGDAIKIGSEIFAVSSITDDANLIISGRYLGETASGLTAYFSDKDLIAASDNESNERFKITSGGELQVASRGKFGSKNSNGYLNLYFWTKNNSASGISTYKRGNNSDIDGAVFANAELGYHNFYGWDGAAYGRAAFAIARATENWTAAAHGSSYSIYTTPNGSITNTARFHIDGNGNIGIGGATNKLSRLTVKAAATFNSSGTVSTTAGSATVSGLDTFFTTQLGIGDRITINGETKTITAIASNTSLTADSVFSASNSDVVMAVLPSIFRIDNSGGTAKLVINDAGNVGIGTTAPGSKLSVSGGAAFGSSYATSSVADGNVAIMGNLGIGMTEPRTVTSINRIDIRGESDLIQNIRIQNDKINSAGAGAFISLHARESGGDAAIGFGIDNDTTGDSIGHSWHIGIDNSDDDKLSFAQGSIGADAKMTITRDGNIGIGLTSPLAKLDISNSNSNASFAASYHELRLVNNDITANNWSGLLFSDSAAYGFDGGIGLQWIDHTDGSEKTDIAFFNRNNGTFGERMRINNLGNLGIGTTSPAELLDVNGRVRLAQTTAPETTTDRLYNVSGNLLWNGVNLTAAGALPVGTEGQMLYNNAGAWTSFDGLYWDDTNSRLGIGTTAPLGQLHIVEDGNTAQIGVDTYSDVASAGSQFFFRRNRGTVLAPLPVVAGDRMGFFGWGGWDGTALANNAGIFGYAAESFTSGGHGVYITFETTATGSASRTEKLRLSSNGGLSLGNGYVGTDPGAGSMIVSGNVGIGTATPATKLDVDGTLGVSANSSYTTSSGAGFVFRNSTSPDYEMYGGYDMSIDGAFLQGVQVAATVKPFYINPRGADVSLGSIGTGMIVKNAGNVGIGTTAPTYKLSVAGDMYTTGTVRMVGGYAAESDTLITSTATVHNDLSYYAPIFQFRKSRGTTASSTSSQSGDTLGTFQFKGAYGTAIQTWASALFGAVQTGDSPDVNSSPAALYFSTSVGGGTGATEKMRILSTGNVGIGTTTPSALLQVNNGSTLYSAIKTGAAVTIGAASGTATQLTMGPTTGSGFGIQGSSGVDTTTRELYLQPFGGNVGIGTTSPAYKLDVNGTFNASATSTFAGYVGIGTTTPGAKLQVMSTADNDFGDNQALRFNNVYGFRVDAGTYTDLHLDRYYSGAWQTPFMSFQRITGNVGIGTTSPAEILDVNGRVRLAQTTAPETTTDKLYNVSGNLLWNGVNLTAAGALPVGTEGQLLYNNAGAWTAFSGLYWDDTNSRLGIGTTTPIYKFNIAAANAGTGVGDASLLGIVNTDTTANNTIGLAFGQANLSGTVQTVAGIDLVGVSHADGAQSGALAFSTRNAGGWGEKLRISEAGNVGIGTTSPAEMLDVAGNMVISGNIVPSANVAYSLGSATNFWESIYVGPGSIYVNGQKVLQTDLSDSVVVSADIDQNLILQTTGDGDIELNPTPSGGGQIRLKGNVILTGEKTFRTTDNSPVIFSDGISTPSITTTVLNGGIAITPNGTGNTYVTAGYFGVGTTSPAEMLDVNGRVRLAQTTAPATTVDKLYNVSGNLLWNGINLTGGGALPVGTEGQMLYNNAGAWSAFSGLYWDDTNSRLGIGTTSPAYKLDVNGTLNASATSTFAGRVGIGTTAPAYDLDVVGAISASTEVGARAGNIKMGSYGGSYGLYTGTSDTTFVHYRSSAYATDLVIKGDSGNVGIGTTAPGAKLDVNGAARVIGAGDPTSGAGMEMSYDGSTWGDILAYDRTNSVYKKLRFRGAEFQLGRSSTNYDLYINSSGNVGFGTNVPGAKLSVSGGGAIGSTYATTTVADGDFIVSGNVGIGTTSPAYTLDVNGGFRAGNATSTNALVFDPNTGNIGIGTTAPTQALDVAGAIAVSGKRVAFRSSGITYLGGGDSGDTETRIRVYGSDKMTLLSSGNVGIGTTSPVEALDVNGRVRLAQTTAPATTTDRLYNVSGNLLWNGVNLTAAGALPVGTEGQMLYNNAGAWSAFSGLHWDDATSRLGIGTTAPIYKFNVAGANASTDVGDASLLGIVNTDTTANNTIGLAFGQANLSGAVQTVAGIDLVGVSHADGAQSGALAFSTRNAGGWGEKLRISEAGNVGIGTTAPGNPLHVYHATTDT
ncbi:MAG: hypothetical protein WBC48_02070, partial [Minisyncoccales bacterium]